MGKKYTKSAFHAFTFLSLCLVSTTLFGQSRGIGVYPGSPAEFFGPQPTPGETTMRNLALHRAAWASSTADYNLTAHLVTDGIVDQAVPTTLVVSTPQGTLSRKEAEWAIDGGPFSSNVLMGSHTWLDFKVDQSKYKGQSVKNSQLGKGLSTISSVKLDIRLAYHEAQATNGYRMALQTSADGQTWQTLGELKGKGLPGTPMRYQLNSDPNKQTATDYLPAREIEDVIQLESAKVKGQRSPLGSVASPGEDDSTTNAQLSTCRSALCDAPHLENFQHLRLLLEMDGAAYWDVHELHFFDEVGQEVWIQPSQTFCSAWMSNGGGLQWIEVDLGGPSHIDHITPHWVEEPRRWHHEVKDDGRKVHLILEEPGPSGCYALSELEVWGTGGVTYSPHAVAGMKSDGRLELSGGAWQLQRASEVQATGEQISSYDYQTQDWIWATVPGTVLTSYINIGAVPNPNYADWVNEISESFFRSDFWYRCEFDAPASLLNSGTLQQLHFDGINWKALVFLNGQPLGHIEGAFMRGQFNVSGLLREGRNVLAVKILCNEHFGSVKEKDKNTTQFNGGILGADNPTFHATIGWDWITTVRGRNAGIWNEVYLTSSSGVTLSDPFVQTRVGEQVTVTPSVFMRNHTSQAVQGVLQGWIGDVRFEQTVFLPANAEREVTFSPTDFPQLTRSDFRLWWPNGYGEPFRYDAGYKFLPQNLNTSKPQNLKTSGPQVLKTSEPQVLKTSEPQVLKTSEPQNLKTSEPQVLTFRAGLREMTYEHIADSLIMRINGLRFVPLGGNWGFDEHNLCYRSREYMTAVAYHRDMHCTMIRNWVGMVGDEAFYEACDSLGIMVWQDFWLANPCDGPDPYDDVLFLSNASDYVRRIRQHPCIGLFCGRNEGYPPTNIDHALRSYVHDLTPGLAYIPSSADDCVTGHGPYCAQPARAYFEKQSGKIHTERGMPAVMNIESLRRTFAPDSLWPQSTQWGQHDYTLLGAQRASEFNQLVEQRFGPSTSAEQFARRAQLINYEGYRAMFESTSRTRSGLLIWMSHPCWPSMVWQTYDYYFDPTAAYFGVKKACEPLHIQLNALTDSVEVVCLNSHPSTFNSHLSTFNSPLDLSRSTLEEFSTFNSQFSIFNSQFSTLTATVTAYDLQGRRLWQQKAKVRCTPDSTTPVMHIDTTRIHNSGGGLLRLQLSNKQQVLSLNDYIFTTAGTTIPETTASHVKQNTTITQQGQTCQATVTLKNTGSTPVFCLRLNLKGSDGEQILPVFYSDNYINLLPGETRTLYIHWDTNDTRAQTPQIHIDTLSP